MPKYKTSSHLYRESIFWVGVIATIAYRLIVVLNEYSAFWVEVTWYIGTLGFIWYFAHRFNVENRREKLIIEKKLAYKVYHGKALKKEDRDALVFILKGLKSSKARWNYIIIFVSSIIALIYAVINDFIHFLDRG
jgi:hypothetical protein